MVGNKNSGRRTARIERRTLKLESLAIDHALEIYETGTPSQKLELTKQIAPKCVQRITDPAAGHGRQIMIMIVPKEQLDAQQRTERLLNAPQQESQPPIVEIVAETAEDTPKSAENV